MNHYPRLAAMTVLSFISMFIFMYAMVDIFGNVYANVNQFYMAGLMTAPMVLIELAVMGSMYKNAKANIAIAAVSLLALAGFFAAIRVQAAVTDAQFLRSMIPHHGGAILMCTKTSIDNPDIKKLCAEIIEGQQSEIARMKTILEAL